MQQTCGAGLGTFYGVGIGPGDPELMTRKAVRVLTEVEWIFYPFETRTGASFSRRERSMMLNMVS